MNTQRTREKAITEAFPARRDAGRRGAAAPIGRMLGRLGVLAAVLALVLLGGAVGRTAEPAAAQATATAVSLRGGPGQGSRYIMQDTPDLRTLNFDNLASFAFADLSPVALYSDANYQGRCQTIDPGMSVPLAGSFVGDKQVSSVRMAPCRSTDTTAPKPWTGNPAATGYGSYVGDVKVINGTSSSVSCGSGWTKDPLDLNKGAGGAYVYLCYKMHNQPTFGLIYAVAGNTPNIPCEGSTHYKVPGNLNERAGGKYIYFCVRPATGEGSVTQFEFIDISGSTPEWVATSSAKTKCGLDGLSSRAVLDLTDLNDGAGGDFIYICVSTTSGGHLAPADPS